MDDTAHTHTPAQGHNDTARPTLKLRAVPLSPDDSDVYALFRLAEQGGGEEVLHGAARELPPRTPDQGGAGEEERAGQRARRASPSLRTLDARLTGLQPGSHRYGYPLSAVSSTVYSRLHARKPLAAGQLLAMWDAAGRNEPEVQEALNAAQEGVRAQAREAAAHNAQDPHLQHWLELRLEQLRDQWTPDGSDVALAGIMDAVSCLAGHVGGSDADSSVGSEMLYFWPSGVSLAPHADAVASNHAGLVMLAVHLAAAAGRPMPALPRIPLQEWEPRMPEHEREQAADADAERVRRSREAWLPLLASLVNAVEERVAEELRGQDLLWAWYDSLGAEADVNGAGSSATGQSPSLHEQVMRALLAQLMAMIAYGGEVGWLATCPERQRERWCELMMNGATRTVTGGSHVALAPWQAVMQAELREARSSLALQASLDALHSPERRIAGIQEEHAELLLDLRRRSEKED